MSSFDIMGDIAMDQASAWPGDVTPAAFKAWIESTSGDVVLNINSGGGNIPGGLAICGLIDRERAAGRRFTARVLGVAASMASVIACACDEIELGEQSYLMIHNPWTTAEGDAEALRKQADTLDSMKRALIGYYRNHFDLDDETLSAVMDAETWISGLDVGGYRAKGVTVTTLEAAACITGRHYTNAPAGAINCREAHMDEDKKPEETEEQVDPVAEEKQEPETAPEVKPEDPAPAEEQQEPAPTEEKPVEPADPAEEQPEQDEADEEKKDEPGNEVARLADCLEKAELKRRDYQAKADRAAAEVKNISAQFEAFKADASAKIARIDAEKRELEARLARIAASTYGKADDSAVDMRTPRQILAALPPSERQGYYMKHRADFN